MWLYSRASPFPLFARKFGFVYGYALIHNLTLIHNLALIMQSLCTVGMSYDEIPTAGHVVVQNNTQPFSSPFHRSFQNFSANSIGMTLNLIFHFVEAKRKSFAIKVIGPHSWSMENSINNGLPRLCLHVSCCYAHVFNTC